MMIGKAIATGKVSVLAAEGFIPGKHIDDAELREVLDWCYEYLRKYRVSPTKGALAERFPKVQFPIPPEPLQYLMDKTREDVKRRNTRRILMKVSQAWDEGIPDIDLFLMDQARSLFTDTPSGHAASYKEMHDRIDRYRAEKANPDLFKGTMMGIPTLDQQLKGMKNGNLITIAGFTGFGKSILLHYFMYQAMLQGKRSLILSLEMMSDDVFDRIDTVTTHVNYDRLRERKLTVDEEKKWEDAAAKAKAMNGDILVMDQLGHVGIDRVYAEVQRHQPDIVGIDHLGLLEPSSDSGVKFGSGQTTEKFKYLTKELKILAMKIGKPVVLVTQSNRSGFTAGKTGLDTLSWSNSVAEDSDVVLQLWTDEDIQRNKQIEVHLVKHRMGKPLKTTLLWDLDTFTITEWQDSYQFTNLASGNGSDAKDGVETPLSEPGSVVE